MTDKKKSKLNIYIEDPAVNYKYRKSYDDLMKEIKEIKEIDGEPTPCMYLVKINWNDYGYETKYFVEYMVDDKSYEIGSIKIGHREMDATKLNITEFLQNGLLTDELDNFYSLAQEEEFYINLRKYCKDEDDVVFLERINECTVLSTEKLEQLHDEFRDNDNVYDISLTRNENFVFTVEFIKLINLVKEQDIEYSEDTKVYNYLMYLYDEIIQSQDHNSYRDIKFKYYEYLIENINKKIKNDDDTLENILRMMKELNKGNTYIINRLNEKLASNKIKNDLFNLIEKIEDKLFLNIDDIDEIYDIDNSCLGHYTPRDTLKYLLIPELIKQTNTGEKESIKENNEEVNLYEKGYLRLSHYKQMNDPLEGEILHKYLFRNSAISKDRSYLYVSAATKEANSLPMWKQYADDATGLFLEYHKKYLKSIIENKDIKIAKVEYLDTDDENDISDNLRALKRKINKIYQGEVNKEINSYEISLEEVINRLEKLSLCFKHVDYSYEKEYRIIIDKKSANNDIVIGKDRSVPRLYTYLTDHRLAYSKIILGPKCIHRDYIEPYINHCAEITGDEIETEQSNIAYR